VRLTWVYTDPHNAIAPQTSRESSESALRPGNDRPARSLRTNTSMNFDDQLTHAFDALTERLRAEIDRQVRATVDDLSAAARADRQSAAAEAEERASRDAAGQLEIAVAAARQHSHEEGLAAGREEGQRDGSATGREEGRREGFDEGKRQGIAEARRETEQAPPPPVADHGQVERLADSVRAIGRGGSLSAILDTLVQRSGDEAARVGVWLLRGESLRHWRSTGFDTPPADVPLQASTALAEAARSNTAVANDEGLAVPIAMSGEVVAVLFASSPGRLQNTDAIDVLTHHAARCLEALTAFKAARALTERPQSEASAN
jgi:hypothetical protein